MRKEFFDCLYEQMKVNNNIWLLTGDLGYGLADKIREDFPDRFLNTGAAEQAMMGIACGLAMEGKIPFVYSITTFLLYRPFETIRTYINHEKLNVKLIGSGRDKDYAHDGFSHDASDVYGLFDTFSQRHEQWQGGFFNNIEALWPYEKEEIPDIVESMVKSKSPEFLSLRR